MLREVVIGLLRVRRAILEEIAAVEAKINQLVAEDDACQSFVAVPGVGPITALSFRTAVDLPQRFANPRTVGVHLGLTPAAYRSGKTDRSSGRISRCGDKATRSTLVLAAKSILGPRTRSSTLKDWGRKVVAARGYMKGVVAVARRLAVMLLKMWLARTQFRNEPPGLTPAAPMA